MTPYQLRFVSPGSVEFDEIGRLVAESCPNECIISMENLVNPGLEQRYQDRKDILSRLGPVYEKRVFHGSRDINSTVPILENGFDGSRNRVSAFGRGTYFATAFSYSKRYSSRNREYKVMLICDIAVQKLVRGRAGENLPPEEGDCWVNRIKDPTIYSVPHNDQSIPRYVVQFY